MKRLLIVPLVAAFAVVGFQLGASASSGNFCGGGGRSPCSTFAAQNEINSPPSYCAFGIGSGNADPNVTGADNRVAVSGEALVTSGSGGCSVNNPELALPYNYMNVQVTLDCGGTDINGGTFANPQGSGHITYTNTWTCGPNPPCVYSSQFGTNVPVYFMQVIVHVQFNVYPSGWHSYYLFTPGFWEYCPF